MQTIWCIFMLDFLPNLSHVVQAISQQGTRLTSAINHSTVARVKHKHKVTGFTDV